MEHDGARAPNPGSEDVGSEFDSGEVETLPDGSISIPVLEEELVITKRTVVRERLIVHKDAEIEHRVVNAELRKERVEARNGDEVDAPAP